MADMTDTFSLSPNYQYREELSYPHGGRGICIYLLWFKFQVILTLQHQRSGRL